MSGMTVFVVLWADPSGGPGVCNVEGVFSSEGRARAAIDGTPNQGKYADGSSMAEIVAFTVDVWRRS